MILFFGLISLAWGFVSAYFIARFIVKHNHVSAALIFMPLGWVVESARELHLLRRWATTPILCASLTAAVFTCLVIFWNEAQQPTNTVQQLRAGFRTWRRRRRGGE